MNIEGTTFKFKQTGATAERVGTPSAPSDVGKIEGQTESQKKDNSAIKTAVVVNTVMSTVKTAVSSAIGNIEGTQLRAQVSALQSGVGSAVGLAVATFSNPYVGLAMVASQAISYSFKAEKFNRDKAWSDYDRSEYISARGFASSYNRSRSDGGGGR